jgi:lysophospholipase L1-like esterase
MIGAVASRLNGTLFGASSEEELANRRRAYIDERRSQLKMLTIEPTDIVFVGDSLTERGEWAELLDDPRIKNRGISGDTAEGVLARIGEIAASRPRAIFLMVGVNDVEWGARPSDVLASYQRILDAIATATPETRVVVQSVLPVRAMPSTEDISNRTIVEINRGLKELAASRKVEYLDVAAAMTDDSGGLDPRYTTDGVHLSGEGYAAWRDALSAALESPVLDFR